MRISWKENALKMRLAVRCADISTYHRAMHEEPKSHIRVCGLRRILHCSEVFTSGKLPRIILRESNPTSSEKYRSNVRVCSRGKGLGFRNQQHVRSVCQRHEAFAITKLSRQPHYYQKTFRHSKPQTYVPVCGNEFPSVYQSNTLDCLLRVAESNNGSRGAPQLRRFGWSNTSPGL